jgi:TetR/AcrR family transcriptional repressor of mexJK operon
MTDAEKPTITKREERRLDRRSAILEVAAASFLENGYAGTTMSAISAQLGGSKGTLWNHFSSKETLFAAFLEEATSVFKQELMTILEPSRDLKSTLETFAYRFMDKIGLPESIKMYRLAVGESGRSPEVGQMFYERAPGAVEAILAQFLNDHMKAGVLRPSDPSGAARFLLAQCVGGSHQKTLCGGPARDPATMRREAAHLTKQFLQLYGTSGEAARN